VSSGRLRDRRPVRARKQVDHLIAVAKLLGHHTERPCVILRLLGPSERALMLLDGAELRRGLRADRRQKMLRGLLGKLLRRERLGLALAVADLHLVRNVRGDLRAEAERLVLGEESVPLLGELRIVGEVVSLPVLDRVVVRSEERRVGKEGGCVWWKGA